MTGAIFAQDRAAIARARTRRCGTRRGTSTSTTSRPARWSASSRSAARAASGTNDKAGSTLNLLRWTSQRAIKENFVPPKDFRYPFMADDATGATAHAATRRSQPERRLLARGRRR